MTLVETQVVILYIFFEYFSCFSYDVQESGRMITYRKVKKDKDINHVHNKEIQIVKETGKLYFVFMRYME